MSVIFEWKKSECSAHHKRKKNFPFFAYLYPPTHDPAGVCWQYWISTNSSVSHTGWSSYDYSILCISCTTKRPEGIRHLRYFSWCPIFIMLLLHTVQPRKHFLIGPVLHFLTKGPTRETLPEARMRFLKEVKLRHS